MTEEELDKRLREIHISGIRYGKTLIEATQIAIRIIRGGYTPKKPLKIIEIIRYDCDREKAEYRISRLKESIKEIMPNCADYILERIKFEIKPMPKVKPKPLEWIMIEDYVDFFKESEEA
jgi:hypothetical protein